MFCSSVETGRKFVQDLFSSTCSTMVRVPSWKSFADRPRSFCFARAENKLLILRPLEMKILVLVRSAESVARQPAVLQHSQILPESL